MAFSTTDNWLYNLLIAASSTAKKNWKTSANPASDANPGLQMSLQ